MFRQEEMVRANRRFWARPCPAKIIENANIRPKPTPTPVSPGETSHKVIAWAHEKREFVVPDLIVPFSLSPETCALDKERYEDLAYVSAHADLVILSGERGLSAVATGVLLAARACGKFEGPKGIRRWVVIVGSASDAIYTQNLLKRVYPNIISSIYVEGVDVPVYCTSTSVLTPIHLCASGIIVLPETAIRLVMEGLIGSYICEDAGGLMDSPAMLHFMELAKNEMRTVKIDNREYTASKRSVGRVIVLSNLREERLVLWADVMMRLRNGGVNVAHHVSLPHPVSPKNEPVKRKQLKRSNAINIGNVVNE